MGLSEWSRAPGDLMMHAVYSSGASREAVIKVAEAARYAPEVERAVAAGATA